jgi:hypothetical protein
MNSVILIYSGQMFFRNFGLRYVNAVFGDFAIKLAGPDADRKIVALFARTVEWLRSRLRLQVSQKSVEAQIQRPLEVGVAEVSFPTTADCCAGR